MRFKLKANGKRYERVLSEHTVKGSGLMCSDVQGRRCAAASPEKGCDRDIQFPCLDGHVFVEVTSEYSNRT